MVGEQGRDGVRQYILVSLVGGIIIILPGLWSFPRYVAGPLVGGSGYGSGHLSLTLTLTRTLTLTLTLS